MDIPIRALFHFSPQLVRSRSKRRGHRCCIRGKYRRIGWRTASNLIGSAKNEKSRGKRC